MVFVLFEENLQSEEEDEEKDSGLKLEFGGWVNHINLGHGFQLDFSWIRFASRHMSTTLVAFLEFRDIIVFLFI